MQERTLSGLSPKQNRNVPPLNYELVYKMNKHPKFAYFWNGGIQSLNQAQSHSKMESMVAMTGRAAVKNPVRFYQT